MFKLKSLKFLLVLLLLVVLFSAKGFAGDVKVWYNPSFKISGMKKIFVYPVAELKAGVQMLPEVELEKKLVEWAISGIKSTKQGKRIIVKTPDEVGEEMKLIYGEEVPSVDVFFQRIGDMGYDAIVLINLVQEFASEHMPEQTINFPTYSNAYITNNKGWVTGTVRIPQNNTISIPEHDVTFLHTVCVPRVYLTGDLKGDYKAMVNYEIYRRYRGGDVMKVVENIIKNSMKTLITKGN